MSSAFADTHNMVSILTKSEASEGFDPIINFLNGSYIKYALTVNPHIYVSCIKQFLNTITVKQSNDVTRLQALVDRKKVVISEDVIRDALRLANAEGVDCLLNKEIFTGLARMGSAMASAVICLSTGENVEEDIAEERIQDDVVVATVQEGVTAVVRVDTLDDTIMEDVSNQWRMIDELDRDEGIALMGEKEEEKKAEEVKEMLVMLKLRGEAYFCMFIDKVSAVKSKFNASNDVTRLQALVDKKKVLITEAVIRDVLCLDDGNGVDFQPNEEIFAGLARSTKLTFYKAFFSSQWKFLIHTILQSISAKRTSWNEFSTLMASAVICLSTGRKFNFSKYIFESLVRNVDNSSKFYMYPRVGKGCSGVETPLFKGMLVEEKPEEQGNADEEVQGNDNNVAQGADTAILGDDVAQDLEITKLKTRVKKLEKANKERMIAKLDRDTGVALMDDEGTEKKEDEPEVQEVVEVVTTVKLITGVVDVVSELVSAASATIAAVLVATITLPQSKLMLLLPEEEKEWLSGIQKRNHLQKYLLKPSPKTREKEKWHGFDLIDGVVAANNPAKFFNHDAYSELVADSFEQEQVSKFIVVKNYAPSDEVRIKYKDIPNDTFFTSKIGIQRKIDEAVQRE
nr:synaptobrevin, longin-like domain protein [Tanacetum cinerariifolium]